MRMSIRTRSGVELASLGERLAAVGGLAHHLEIGLGLEDHAQATPHERLVVGNENPGHVRRPVEREKGRHGEAACPAASPGLDPAPVLRHALPHTDQAVTRIRSRAPVGPPRRPRSRPARRRASSES